MRNMIANRTIEDVNWLKHVSAKNWDDFTDEEKKMWRWGFLCDAYDANKKRLYADGMKIFVRAGSVRGAYNSVDYNRIGSAIQDLSRLLNDLGYTVSVTARDNWTESNFPSETARAALLSDLNALKDKLYGTFQLPAVWEYLTFEDANNAEKLLLEIEWNIYCMLAGAWYSGELYSGEV